MESTALEAAARGTTPALSVVIASVNGWSVLEPTLKALDVQPERDRMEIVVVETVGGETRDRLEAHEPRVTIVPLDEKRPIPRLRYLGVTRARGEVVAILEDHGEVAADWAAQVLTAHDGPWGAVGGSVENGREGLVNRSAFFCEYTAYMGPVAEGEAADLPGNNIAYKRPHLMRHARVLDDGKWESWINEKLRADGVPTASTNRMVVRHIKPFRLGYFLVQRFHFSRSYAGMRRVDQTRAKRLIYGLGSLALPGLLMLRVTRNVLAKRRHVARFALCSPLVALFFAIGAVGEMIGYLLGPGRSLELVE
jgi:hypothetical protein